MAEQIEKRYTIGKDERGNALVTASVYDWNISGGVRSFAIRWVPQHKTPDVFPSLVGVGENSLAVFAICADVFAELATWDCTTRGINSKPMGVADYVAILERGGFSNSKKVVQ